AKPMLITGGIETNSKDVLAMAEKLKENLPKEMPKDELSVFDIMKMMPESQRLTMVEKINEQFKEMLDTIVNQSAIAYTKNEYEKVGIDTKKMQTNYIVVSGIKMLGIALLSMAAAIMVGFLASRVAATLGKDLRNGVFKKVISFSNVELDKFSTATLITRSTNDIQQVQMLMVMLLRMVFYAPILCVGGIIKVLGTNTKMAWIIAVAVMSILSIVLVVYALAMPKVKILQKLIDKLNLITREILTGIPVIRAFSKQKHEEKRFDEANTKLKKVNLYANRIMICMMPMMMLVMNLITILIVWRGAHGINDGQMQVGDLMAFIQYTMQIIMSFLMLSMVSVMIPRAAVSVTRISEVLKTDTVINETKQPKSSNPNLKGYIEFKNVCFSYPNAEEDVISDISFVAKPNQTTAFIGSTGSGKSTLVNLIPRFYD
ncbi:MAG: ABC transporter ATP-binding protein, partial [Oscillospiraceae bacterium]